MPDDAETARCYVKRIQAEVIQEAQGLRTSNPKLLAQEREFNQAWHRATQTAVIADCDIVLPHQQVEHDENLLDYLNELSLLNVDAPEGKKVGVRQIKSLSRKFTRWYLRYLADQVNAFNHFLVNLLRDTEQRIARLESDARVIEAMAEFVDPLPDTDPDLAQAVVSQLLQCDGIVAVMSCGAGKIVSALADVGITAHGIDESADAVCAGVNHGLDLRVVAPMEHLSKIAAESLDAVVLTGFVERCGPVEIVQLIDKALRCVVVAGQVVVAVADPADRAPQEAELLRGAGLSPQTWAQLLQKRGCLVELTDVTGSRVTSLVTAKRQ